MYIEKWRRISVMTILFKDYWASTCLRLTFVLILTVFVAVGCGGSGDADPAPSDNNTPAGRSLSTGDATGTYLYDSETDTLTVDLSSSSFQSDCGPQIEVSELTVLELTATTIRLKTDPDSDEMTWTRASGSADSVIGTWSYSEGSITDATITFNADGTFSISGTFECDDSGTITTYYRDFDGDGYGDQSVSIEDGTQPPSYVSNSADCDDTHGDIHPSATEICGDSEDNDCDGLIDEGCFSEPRFTDMRDGTVRDNDTGLIWLKDANAFGEMNGLGKCPECGGEPEQWGERIIGRVRRWRLAIAHQGRMGSVYVSRFYDPTRH